MWPHVWPAHHTTALWFDQWRPCSPFPSTRATTLTNEDTCCAPDGAYPLPRPSLLPMMQSQHAAIFSLHAGNGDCGEQAGRKQAAAAAALLAALSQVAALYQRRSEILEIASAQRHDASSHQPPLTPA